MMILLVISIFFLAFYRDYTRFYKHYIGSHGIAFIRISQNFYGLYNVYFILYLTIITRISRDSQDVTRFQRKQFYVVVDIFGC